MSKKALIIVGPEFEDIELLYPLYRLREEGLEVDVTTHPSFGEVVEGKHGYKVRVTKSLEEVRIEDYELLVLPGGRGPERIRVYSEIVDLVVKFLESKKKIAAICHGPQLLISAEVKKKGLISGRKMTCVPTIKDDLVAVGALWEDKPVVVDDNLITSRVPPDIPAWMREVIKAL